MMMFTETILYCKNNKQINLSEKIPFHLDEVGEHVK